MAGARALALAWSVFGEFWPVLALLVFLAWGIVGFVSQ